VIKKVLIANRGEIAVRIARAAQELGIATVAVCSEADRGAVHVRVADQHVVIGPAPAAQSYLNTDAILAAAHDVGADSVHPGYGFLSERADFAQLVIDAEMTWVGPSPEAIRLMGDKAQARATAASAGVPTVPGSDGPVLGLAEAILAANEVGYPVVVKAAAGGGGQGIRIVASADEMAQALPIAQAEASAAFGDRSVYVERFIGAAKHIEVQVFGDGETYIHLGGRDCSMQRRRQKVVEEAGDLLLPSRIREDMTTAAVRLAEAVKYEGAGTVEFLYDSDRDEFFFIEMNTRIQVEHPVTEMLVGRDLVQEQLRVASGHRLPFSQDDVVFRGHSIEARLNAEDSEQGFMPSPGTLASFRMPGGPFVRVDSGYETGSVVSPYYDSLLAKIIVWGETRDEALSRLRRALAEVEILGVASTLPFLRSLVELPQFQDGSYGTTFLETWMSNRSQTRLEELKEEK
jgi:acetyl-CoA carboxylase biotin carboxylase subunit